MAKLMIRTQVMENYGSAENPHWKAKGGNDYVVKNFTAFNAVPSYIMMIRDRIEIDNDFCREYIVDYNVETDDYLTHDEKLQLRFDGKISYPAQEVTYGGV